MKIALVNGSPKNKDSASEVILKALCERVGEASECVPCSSVNQSKQEIMEAVSGCKALIFAFPLYVDGIPSHLLRLLDEMQHDIADAVPGAMVYVIVNNGFYEGSQNITALEMMRNFCVSSGLAWGQGMCVGAGGMANAAPVGHGPMKNLGLALDRLSINILDGKSVEDYIFEPNFPRFLYKAAAHMGWRMQARKNGLKIKQLYEKAPKRSI